MQAQVEAARPTGTALRRFREAIETRDFAKLADAYVPEATLDANLTSGTRITRRGRDAVVAQYEQWVEHFDHFVEWRERAADRGAVVELVTAEGEGGRQYFREVYLITMDGDRIREHVIYCTGPYETPSSEAQA